MNLFNKKDGFCEVSIHEPLASTLLRTCYGSVVVAMETWKETFHLSFAGLL